MTLDKNTKCKLMRNAHKLLTNEYCLDFLHVIEQELDELIGYVELGDHTSEISKEVLDELIEHLKYLKKMSLFRAGGGIFKVTRELVDELDWDLDLKPQGT